VVKKRITIDPITRLEGHGKIEIFLDDKGDVDKAYFQVPELRGFEKFCESLLKYAACVPLLITWHLQKHLIPCTKLSRPLQHEK